MSESPVSGQGVRQSLPLGLPRIVCLCGSTRFMSAFDDVNRDETLAGRIVLTVGVDLKDRHKEILAGKTEAEAAAIKDRLDCLHRRKIDLADEILNNSTRMRQWCQPEITGNRCFPCLHTLSFGCGAI